MRDKKKKYILYSIFTVFVLFLIFYRLDYPFLWADEADTAVLGKRVIAFGVPKVWDGRNLITQFGHGHQKGSYDFNSDLIHTWQPWPQFYIAAASLSILGNNTLACRLPFAIIGFLTFIFYLYFCKRYLRLGTLYYLPGLLLLLSVPFFLHVRQCRYYSLNILLTLLFVHSFLLLTRKKRYSGIYFSVAGTALIFNNILVFVPTFSAFLIYLLLNLKKRFDFKYMVKPGIFLAIGLFCFMGFRVYLDAEIPAFFEFSLYHFSRTLPFYAITVNSWCFPFIVPVFLGILAIINRSKDYRHEMSNVFKNETLHLFGLIIISNIVFLSCIIQTNFRYIIHILPLILIFLAYILFLIYKKNKVLYVLLLCCFLFTDLVGRSVTRLPFFMLATWAKRSEAICALLTDDRFLDYTASFSRTAIGRDDNGEIINKDALKIRICRDFIDKYEKININSPFFVFLNKIIKPYPDVNTCIIKFLIKNSKKDDVVVTNYGDEPIIFYTDLVVRGGLRGVGISRDEDLGKKNIFRQLGISKVKNPDWVILRNGWGFQDELREIVKNGSYKRIELNCPDSQWGNSSDPNYYVYDDSSKYPNVLIYKRE